MKYVFVFIILFLFRGVKAQNVSTFRFVVENKILVDSSTGFYDGASYEFSYKRIYRSDSIFEEAGLFGESKNATNVFKINRGCWYVKVGNKWRIFYSCLRSINPKVEIYGNWYFFKFIGHQLLNGVECVLYKAQPIGVKASGDMKYWFSPKLGIIKIETNEITLIREDIKIKAP